MPLSILSGGKAARFAEKYNPVVIQYMTGNDPRDNIEPFYAGPFDGSKPPVAYYAVKRDELRGYTCAWYHWFHRLDWGGAADFLGGGIDKHPGDFEGCCICVPDDESESFYWFTRSHSHILLRETKWRDFSVYVVLESKGHGCTKVAYPKSCDHRVYYNLDLVPLYNGEFYSAVAADMQVQFREWGSVDWMDQYTDQRLTLKRIAHTGDYWNDPLALVEKMGRQYP